MRTNFRTLQTVLAVAILAAITFNLNLSAQPSRFRLGGTPPAAAKEQPKPAAETPAVAAEPTTSAAEKAVDAQIDAKIEAAKKQLARETVQYIDQQVDAKIRVAIDDKLVTVNNRMSSMGTVMSLIEVVIFVLNLVVILMFVGPKMRRRTMMKNPLPVLLFGLLLLPAISSLTAATPPAPTITCKTAAADPAFFANDGATSDVVCNVRGITAASAVTFADSALTTSDVKLTGSKLTFKLTVGTGATTPNEPDMSVDGTVVGHPIAVLETDDAGKMDLTLRYLKGGSAGSSDEKLFRSFLVGLAQHYGLDQKQLISLLQSSKAGTSKEAVGLIEAARQHTTVEAVYSDDRMNALLNATAANAAAQRELEAAFSAHKAEPAHTSTITTTNAAPAVSDDHIRDIAAEQTNRLAEATAKGFTTLSTVLGNHITTVADKRGRDRDVKVKGASPQAAKDASSAASEAADGVRSTMRAPAGAVPAPIQPPKR